MSMKALKIIDGLCIALFIFLMVYIFVLPIEQQYSITPVISFIYRTGAWFIGIGLLLTCLFGR